MIYFDVELEEGDTIYELLRKGFKGDYGQFVNTYKEPREPYDSTEGRNIQCYRGNRSYLDLLEICRTYFPDTTENNLKRALMRACEDPEFKLHTLYCADIEEWVFFRMMGSFDSLTEDIKSRVGEDTPYSCRLEAIAIMRNLLDPDDRHSVTIDTKGSGSELSLIDICKLNAVEVCV